MRVERVHVGRAEPSGERVATRVLRGRARRTVCAPVHGSSSTFLLYIQSGRSDALMLMVKRLGPWPLAYPDVCVCCGLWLCAVTPVLYCVRYLVCVCVMSPSVVSTLGAPCFHKVFQDARSEKALRTDALRDGSIPVFPRLARAARAPRWVMKPSK